EGPMTMNNHSQQIVQKLWSYCNLLRDDGLSYGDYIEQLTYLLFLKMAYERTQLPWSQPSVVPTQYDWQSLMTREGDELETHYRHILQELGKEQGMLGIIFRNPGSRGSGWMRGFFTHYVGTAISAMIHPLGKLAERVPHGDGDSADQSRGPLA